uniref:Ig-like domain-containing protein n=1 Tax=Plectus sambesii TaxID=2011161 RepID=A0A914VRZ4_9BILA
MVGTLGAAAGTASLLLLLFATTCCLSAPGIHHRLPTLTLRSDAPYLERKHKTVMRCVVEWPGADPAVVGAIKLDDVKWMKDGTPIAELDKTQGSDDLKETGAELRVLHGKRQSEGDFQCSGLLRGVQLGDGRAVDVQLVSAPLKVKRARLSKFERLSKEEEVHAIQGHVARLPCSGIPDSIPGPAIIWFERAGDDRRLGVEERKNRYLGTSSGLQIAVVQPRDAGKYFCVATNPYTNQTRHSKNAVNLVVDDRAPTLSSSFTPHFVYPEPTKTHMVVEVAVGHSALLECVVAGGKVVWEKVNASLPVSLTDDGARVRQVWGNLRINEVSVDDAGTYVCHALSPIANADLSHPDHPRVTYK